MNEENILKMKWSKRDNCLKVWFPRSCDGQLLYSAFSDKLIYSHIKARDGSRFPFETENLKNELESRGYDITTLKFEIKLKTEL